MDPNETLARLRDLVAKMPSDDAVFDDINAIDACEMAELIDSLDEWLSKGGFLPTDWER